MDRLDRAKHYLVQDCFNKVGLDINQFVNIARGVGSVKLLFALCDAHAFEFTIRMCFMDSSSSSIKFFNKLRTRNVEDQIFLKNEKVWRTFKLSSGSFLIQTRCFCIVVMSQAFINN